MGIAQGEAPPAPGREADFAFHRSLARATHNDVLTALFETLAEALSMALEAVHRTIAALPERLWSVRRDHRAIYAAVMKKDGRAAHRAMLRHLSRVEVWFGCAPEGLRQPCPVMMNEFHE
ncbi:MAG: FadR family transcriptional regulator [Hydrogenibacillus sp.]|nr:FadR family transcriptional regulator [Hydrogenibacillus sp.]